MHLADCASCIILQGPRLRDTYRSVNTKRESSLQHAAQKALNAGRSRDGATPLMLACDSGDEESVRWDTVQCARTDEGEQVGGQGSLALEASALWIS